jgi:hypothetical protein
MARPNWVRKHYGVRTKPLARRTLRMGVGRDDVPCLDALAWQRRQGVGLGPCLARPTRGGPIFLPNMVRKYQTSIEKP